MSWRERLAVWWEAVEDYALLAWWALIETAWWLHEESDRTPWVSWICHAGLALPLVWVFGGWAPLAVFLYRELEQAAHAHVLNDAPLTRGVVIDRVMDVLAPALVGLWLG